VAQGLWFPDGPLFLAAEFVRTKFVLLERELATLRDRVPAVVLELSARIGLPMEFAEGARLFAAGDDVPGLHVILSGAVRIVREGEGRSVVVHREQDGGLLGEVALFSEGVYPASAFAVVRTRALLLPARALWRELRISPGLAEVLLRRLAGRTREIIARLDSLAHQSVLRRLARHLVRRATESAMHDGPISLGMTQVGLAEELGTVKEVIVRELRTLRQLRLIEPTGRGLYRVVDLPALRALAGDESSRGTGRTTW
jgi:CRP/FNR family transcriptional regulator